MESSLHQLHIQKATCGTHQQHISPVWPNRGDHWHLDLRSPGLGPVPRCHVLRCHGIETFTALRSAQSAGELTPPIMPSRADRLPYIPRPLVIRIRFLRLCQCSENHTATTTIECMQYPHLFSSRVREAHSRPARLDYCDRCQARDQCQSQLRMSSSWRSPLTTSLSGAVARGVDNA